ncbi:Retrotransposon-derived protein peg10 [Entomophthora muscae]|uniref:Retrotransposon-derived protein peg10 n=1 Tax=Entomophthora muscae TaxID=34485 RepID=A0ACC2SG11_9FUNG|nr:Retrotransposon-derived protein peg10 [Entomophthora muscae]
MDLSSLLTPRRSSILQRSSPVTTEIDLALTQYNYDIFVKSLLSFSGEDKESSTPSASQLQASDAEACSFYKIGLNKLLQEFLIHHKLTDELEPLIREVVPLSSTPPPGTKPKAGGGFCLTSKEVLRRRNNKLCSYCGSKDHLLLACPLSKCSPLINKTSTLTLLSLSDTSKSPTVLVTIHEPLGKIKVLALLDTGANANFIEEKLANLIELLSFGSLDVKVENSTLTGATPILQPVTIDLEGSPFRVMCNSSPNLSFPFILGFPCLESLCLNLITQTTRFFLLAMTLSNHYLLYLELFAQFSPNST